jgi:hypothetical protein
MMTDIDKHLTKAVEEIDAMMFSGDCFTELTNRSHLRDMILRWEREMQRFDEMDDELTFEAEQEAILSPPEVCHKTAARLRLAQEFLDKKNSEMEELLKPMMHPWSHYCETGVISACSLGKLVRITGWTMAYLLGETDNPLEDPVEVRGIACKEGELPIFIREMKPDDK